MSELNKWTVPKLKQECTKRKLETTGKKTDLIDRLTEYLTQHRTDALASLVHVPEEEEPEEEEEEEEEEAAEPEGGVDEVMAEIDKTLQEGDKEEAAEKTEEKEEKTEEPETIEIKDEEAGGDADKPAENGDDKKESTEETAKDEKKEQEEKKKEPKVFQPCWEDFRFELKKQELEQTICISPFVLEDLQHPVIQECVKNSEQFSVSCALQHETDSHKGHLLIRLKDADSLQKALDEVEEIKEGMRAALIADESSLTAVQTQVKYDKGEYMNRECIVGVYSIPKDTTTESLSEVFTDAKSIILGHDPRATELGYAFLEYETPEAAQEAVTKYTEQEVEFEETKAKFYIVPEERPEFSEIMSQKERREVEKKMDVHMRKREIEHKALNEKEREELRELRYKWIEDNRKREKLIKSGLLEEKMPPTRYYAPWQKDQDQRQGRGGDRRRDRGSGSGNQGGGGRRGGRGGGGYRGSGGGGYRGQNYRDNYYDESYDSGYNRNPRDAEVLIHGLTSLLGLEGGRRPPPKRPSYGDYDDYYGGGGYGGGYGGAGGSGGGGYKRRRHDYW